MADLQLLAFALGGSRFALPAALLREVVRAVAVAPLPRAPAIVEGVINVRGTIVPVLDIRGRFGLPPDAPAPDQHFLVAQAGGRVVALRVDRAEGLLSVDDSAVEPAERAAPGAELVAGIARLPDGVLVIHDLEAFLSLDEGRAVDAALAGAGAGGRSAARGT